MHQTKPTSKTLPSPNISNTKLWKPGLDGVVEHLDLFTTQNVFFFSEQSRIKRFSKECEQLKLNVYENINAETLLTERL